MKKQILLIAYIVCTCGIFAQGTVFISPQIDTTNARNKAILELWKEYRQKLSENIKSQKKVNDLTRYWSSQELAYSTFDLYHRGLLRFSYIFPSYALKINPEGNDVFSLLYMTTQVDFMKNRDSLKCEDYYPQALFSVKVIKDSTGYKLANAFTFNKAKKHIFKTPEILYYYDKDYPFDTLATTLAYQKLIDFSTKYKLSLVGDKPIEFFVYQKYSQMNSDFGFDMHPGEYPTDVVPDIGGTQIHENRMAFYGGHKAESNIHEIIHILLRQISPTPTLLEEGVCTYYGGSMGKSYEELKIALIAYLKKLRKEDYSTTNPLRISEREYNHTYTSMAVLIEEMEKQEGVEYVLEVLKSSKNGLEEEFWNTVKTYFNVEQSGFIDLLIKFLGIDE